MYIYIYTYICHMYRVTSTSFFLIKHKFEHLNTNISMCMFIYTHIYIHIEHCYGVYTYIWSCCWSYIYAIVSFTIISIDTISYIYIYIFDDNSFVHWGTLPPSLSGSSGELRSIYIYINSVNIYIYIYIRTVWHIYIFALNYVLLFLYFRFDILLFR